MLRPASIVILMILWISGLQAQQRWFFSHLGRQEGLVSNKVMAVQQDAKGYIWIATTEGLQRFDGQRFVVFRHKASDPGSIPNDKILHAQLDKKNRLWLLFDYNELGYITPDDRRFHRVPVRFKAQQLKSAEGHLYMDISGNIFLILYNEAVLCYDQQVGDFSAMANPFPLPFNWHPTRIFQDSVTHSYWIGSDSGLVKYNPARKMLSWRGHNVEQDPVIEHYARLTHVSLPYLDQSGRFWLSSWPPHGNTMLFSYDTHSGREKEWEPSLFKLLRYKYHEIQYLNELSDGTLWIAGVDLLAMLKKNSDNFEILQSQLSGEFSLHYDHIHHLMEDREHNIWLASDKGLYRFNPAAQVFHTVTNRRPGKDTVFTPDATDILEARDGTIFVSTWGNGLFAYDSNFNPVETPVTRPSLQQTEMLTWCIHQRGNGDLWRGNQDGLLWISHAATGRQEALRLPVFRSSTIRQITEDNQANLWLGTQKGDLIKWEAASNNFIQVQHLGSSVVRLYKDWQGDVWVCTVKDGVYRVHPPDGRILAHYSSQGPNGQQLTDIGVTDIVQYSDSLFVIASGPLHILNAYTQQVNVIRTINGIPANTVTNIINDGRGTCWVTTENGLYKINISTGAGSNFNESVGIGAGSFSNAASCQLRDGRIVIGTSHDLTVFQPREITTETQQPPAVEITNFSLMNKWLPMDSLSRLDHIALPYDGNAIHIEFSTLTYQSSFNIFYKLENLDKDWIASESSEAMYNYIPPGEYVFKVEARNPVGGRSITTTSVKITVAAPFWQTWWFYSFLLLAAMALLYWFDWQRMYQKEELQKMRSNISDNLHEDVNTALQHINVLSEIARIKARKEPEQSITYINEIHHKSRSMIISMEDMLWSINPANDKIERVAARMKEFAAALSGKLGVYIEIRADEKILSRKPDMKIRHELIQLYKLSLRLVVEEMNAAETIIWIDQEGAKLSLHVYASGPKHPLQHSSLKVREEMRVRTLAMKGTIDFQFDEGKTVIMIIFPSIS